MRHVGVQGVLALHITFHTLPFSTIMIQLSHNQWDQLNQFTHRIHSASSKLELIELVIGELFHQIDSSWAAWYEHDTVIQVEEIHVTPTYEEEILRLFPVVIELIATHPVIEGAESIWDLRLNDGVFAFNDMKSTCGLGSLPIWLDASRKVGTRHLLATRFLVENEHGVTLTLNGNQPFTSEQRTILEILSKHLSIACRRVAGYRASISDKMPEELSRRERETLPYLLTGKTNPEIALILGISHRTVEKHVASILAKTGMENRRMLMMAPRPAISGNRAQGPASNFNLEIQVQ